MHSNFLKRSFFTLLIFFILSGAAACENKKKSDSSDTGNTSDSGDTGDSADTGNSGDSALPDSNGSVDDDSATDSDSDINDSDTPDEDATDDELKDETETDADTADDNTIESDDEVEKPDENERVMTAVISLPTYSSIHEGGKPFQIKGEVSDSKYPSDQLDVKWEIKKQSQSWSTLIETKADILGITEFQHTIPESEADYFALRLTVKAPDNIEFKSQEKIFGICTYPFGKIQDFNNPLENGWVLSGDAFLDSDGTNGWLELTGDDYNKRGVIYNNLLQVYPGDITIKLDIRTGQPTVPGDSGADGFAMTVFDADNTVALADYVATVKTGGCLGYGVAGEYCGSGGEINISAFHIEFDTWYNSEFGLDDPTTENHIAINLNGDPGGHQLWKNIFLEDSLWHSIEVTTSGSDVIVKMDGNTLIDNDIEGFSFRGGYIVFSGSTGAAKNLHSVDNLEVVQECRVP